MNTAQDLVAYLLAATGGGAQDGEHQAVRHAIIHGYREVSQARNWKWFYRHGSFHTRVTESFATVAESERVFRVSSTQDIAPGRVIDFGSGYFEELPIVTRVSGDLVFVDRPALKSGSNVRIKPQVFYDLPQGLKDIDTLATDNVGTLHCYITPQEWMNLEVNTRVFGEPYYYTVMPSDTLPGRWQVRFVGMPQNKTVVHYTYRKTPQPIKYMGYERLTRQGTVELSNIDGVLTVTGTKTNFPQDVAGCYIRFGADGMEADPIGSTVPFVMERRIERWLSATSLDVSDKSVEYRQAPDSPASSATDLDAGNVLVEPPDAGTVDGNIDAPYTTTLYRSIDTPLPPLTKYAITDVLDLSPQMYTAVLSGAELWYARVAGKPADSALAVFNRDLRIAMENDAVTPWSGRPTNMPHPTPRTMGWYSPQLPDVE